MKSVREQFEEIWPVPDGVYWSPRDSGYIATNKATDLIIDAYNARLDTFTRCQETTDVYVSLIKEMIDEIMSPFDTEYDGEDWCNRAKQILGREK